MEFDKTLRLCQEGDAPAWEALVRTYQGRVYAVAVSYLKTPDDALDAAQETFIRVYTRLHKFQGESQAFLPWLLTIARNCCIDKLRKDNNRNRYEEEYRQSESSVDSKSNPEKQLQQLQTESLLYRALDGITPQNRDIVILKDIQGLSLKDVAGILCLPEGTIKSRAFRARAELSRLLSELKSRNRNT